MPYSEKKHLTPTEPPLGASNLELVTWAFDVINGGDISSLMPFWEGAVEYFPGVTAHGPREIAAYFDEAVAAIPDFKLEIQAIAENGEHVLVHWRATGHFTGAPFQGVTPTGKAIELDGFDHFVIRDNRVITNHIVYDRLAYAQQIGMVPRDGTIGDRAVKSIFNLKTQVAERIRR